MRANSRVPESAQHGVHEQLPYLLERHRQAPFRKPCADYNRRAFDAGMARWQAVAPAAPLILDACCGTGESSIALARHFPDHYVIGVDQSVSRLRRFLLQRQEGEGDLPPNVDCLRADLVDFWRLSQTAGIRLARHYVLYPNPWPKIGHLARRWHGHAVFPSALALGGVLECRSNWRIYVEEFSLAVRVLTGVTAGCERYLPDCALTPFERKYLASEHALFRCVADLRCLPGGCERASGST